MPRRVWAKARDHGGECSEALGKGAYLLGNGGELEERAGEALGRLGLLEARLEVIPAILREDHRLGVLAPHPTYPLREMHAAAPVDVGGGLRWCRTCSDGRWVVGGADVIGVGLGLG